MKKIIKNFCKHLYYFLIWKKPDLDKIERFVPKEKEFFGKKLYIHDIASFNLCNEELFQSEMYKFNARRPNPCIIDCGANMGMSVIYSYTKTYEDR